jgi:hypothetical protein
MYWLKLAGIGRILQSMISPGAFLLIMNYPLKLIVVVLLCPALSVVTGMITENNSIRLLLTLMYTCAFVVFLSRPSMKHQ